MFYYYNALQTKSGDILPDYLVRLLDADGNEVDIYADDSETPIITVSGVANAAKADDLGMVRFWVPNGIYDLSIYDATDTFKGSEPGIPMFDAGAVVSDLASHDADKGASLVSMEGGGTVEDAILARPTTAVLASSTGGEMVGLADGRDLQAYIADQGVYNAAINGVSASASAADNLTNLQAAADYVSSNPGLILQLPPGKIDIAGDIIVGPRTDAGSTPSDFGTVIRGTAGTGENGTWLNFTSGSLRIRTAGHWLEDFRITSADSNGIMIEPNDAGTVYAVRAGMQNVRAEHCALSGFTFSDCWVYQMINCFGRYNDRYGIEGLVGPNFGTACNGLEIYGGEYQGNGTKEGVATGSGGSLRGSGGGIFTGRCVQVNLRGVSIEGNIGDGLKFGEQVRGAVVDGCYFEKNGSHPDNCDICNDMPGSTVNGPTAVKIINPNFTAQNLNGTAQVRPIDLYDVLDLQIENPQIFGSASVSFSGTLIRVRESTAGRATGWVSGGWLGYSGYDPANWILNETARFGFPRKHVYSPNLEMTKGSGDTSSQRYFIRVPTGYGQRVDVKLITRAAAGSGVGRIQRSLYRGQAGTLFSGTAFDVTYTGATNSVYTDTFSSSATMPGTHVEVQITRDQDHANDTLAASLFLQSIEITLYEGRVSAA